MESFRLVFQNLLRLYLFIKHPELLVTTGKMIRKREKMQMVAAWLHVSPGFIKATLYSVSWRLW